jgi:hypothetical protein
MTDSTNGDGARANGNVDSAAANDASAAAVERAARLREQRAKAGRPAAAARTLVAGISGTAMFGLIAAMGASAADNSGYVPPPTTLTTPAGQDVTTSTTRSPRLADATGRTTARPKKAWRAVPRTAATTTIPVATTVPPTAAATTAAPVATTRQSS